MIFSTSKNGIEIKVNDIKIILATKFSVDLKQEYDIKLYATAEADKVDDHSIIAAPGEFEIKGVFIYSIDSNDDGNSELFGIDAGKEKLIINVGSTLKQVAKLSEDMGYAEFLLMDAKGFSEDLNDYSNELEPELILIFGDDESVEQSVKKSGLVISEKVNKFKTGNLGTNEETKTIKIIHLS